MSKRFLLINLILILGAILFGCSSEEQVYTNAFDYTDETYRQIVIGEDVLTLPITYQNIINHGFTFKDENDATLRLEGLKHSPVVNLINEDKEINVQFINRSPKEQLVKSCDIFSLEAFDNFNYRGITPEMSKSEVRNIMISKPDKEYVNDLEPGYISDIWYMEGKIDNYKVGGKINITYHNDKVSSVEINCSYYID